MTCSDSREWSLICWALNVEVADVDAPQLHDLAGQYLQLVYIKISELKTTKTAKYGSRRVH